ncbi:MAG: hypothetical protein U9P73_00025 [Candidatus Cloacimonadota bacterium]|nr:hypothetical protein [Candidatus Cloacimonadota bacterium]
MDKKSFFENIKREANVALSRVFDKVEEVSKISALKLKISNFTRKIKDHKTEIGEFVMSNKKKFSEFPEIIAILDKIKLLEKQIKAQREQIIELQERKEDKTEIKEDKNTSS